MQGESHVVKYNELGRGHALVGTKVRFSKPYYLSVKLNLFRRLTQPICTSKKSQGPFTALNKVYQIKKLVLLKNEMR